MGHPHRALAVTAVAAVALGLALAGCGADGPASEPASSAGTASVGAVADPADGAPAGSEATSTSAAPGAERSVAVGSPSVGPGGNRVITGRAGLGAVEPVDIALPGIPALVLPATSGWLGPDGEPVDAGWPAPAWIVTLDDGSTVAIDETGALVDGVSARSAPTVDGFGDPLPDAVVVEAMVDGGAVAVALTEPTDRYAHGALGDRIEAAAVEVIGPAPDQRRTFGPQPPAVIEGISAIVADATGDGVPEVLVTEADADQGASLALWSLDGELVARSAGIGLANRWRNQLAIAPVGPDGAVEIIDVRTPHIGGIVQYFRLEGDELVRVASRSGFTTHRLGSRNLDLGVVFDADGDGALDVVAPTDRREALGVLTRSVPQAGAGDDDGVVVTVEVPLPGRMTTNLAVGPPPPVDGRPGTDNPDGPLAVAVGTDERVLRIWPAPAPGDR